jgi:hypothetical protein
VLGPRGTAGVGAPSFPTGCPGFPRAGSGLPRSPELALHPLPPSPAGRTAPSCAPSSARCGWRTPAPRLTLQLGRRLAIGLKIAASPPSRAPVPAPAPRPALLSRPPARPPGPARPRSAPLPSPAGAAAAGRPRAPLRLPLRFPRARLVRAAAMQRRGALFSMPGGSGSRKMAAGDIGELLVPHMPTIRVPRSGDRVYKSECAFSYDSPVSEAPRGGSRCWRPVPAASLGPRRHVRQGTRCTAAAGDLLLPARELALEHCRSSGTERAPRTCGGPRRGRQAGLLCKLARLRGPLSPAACPRPRHRLKATWNRRVSSLFGAARYKSPASSRVTAAGGWVLGIRPPSRTRTAFLFGQGFPLLDNSDVLSEHRPFHFPFLPTLFAMIVRRKLRVPPLWQQKWGVCVCVGGWRDLLD